MIDPLELLMQAARPTEDAAQVPLPHGRLADVYGCCTRMLSPGEMAQIVQRCCEQATPRERSALARLLHWGFAAQADPAARAWRRIDPHGASPVQVAQMHLAAHQRYPAMLDQLVPQADACGLPGAHRAFTSIATEGARALLGR